MEDAGFWFIFNARVGQRGLGLIGYTEFEEEEESASPLATLVGSLALCSDGFAPRGVTDGSDSPPPPTIY